MPQDEGRQGNRKREGEADGEETAAETGVSHEPPKMSCTNMKPMTPVAYILAGECPREESGEDKRGGLVSICILVFSLGLW